MVPLAIDAMGGDNAPQVVIEGVCDALERFSGIDKLLLVGDRPQIETALQNCRADHRSRIEIEHTDQIVAMDEPPAAAIRSKPKSSIALAVEAVKQGRAGGVISAGHTGAAVASTVLKLRTLPGIERPGIATVFPSPSGCFLLLDAGANVDCKPRHLTQYAVMGEIYAREILNIKKPRIGLINVGDEAGKGNDLSKAAYEEISKLADLNFIGNIEGSALFRGTCDVVVCDGFVGNVILKSCESLAGAFGHFLKKLLVKNPVRQMGAFLC
ncbi:MAG: phosphate acyltransferase PlsX, partial [Candidatus Pacebacteria bacterium]|nr:phosphate acyltransferase PlsX [Candidatus Paceibacterota bacterium]